MKVKIEWWGSILTPENDQDGALLDRLYDLINEVEPYQPYYDPGDCVFFKGSSLVLHREAPGVCDFDG
jgi:hypothetical protein